MATRRRRKIVPRPTPENTPEDLPFSELPKLGLWCSECLKTGLREEQRMSRGGETCKFGHGGGEGSPVDANGHGPEDVPFNPEMVPDDAPFRVRKGDTMTVKFDGANLQIAKFSSVRLDSAIYSRQLRLGEDPDQAFDEIYGYLRRKCLAVAVTKLQDFSEELAKAKRTANGE